MSPKRAAFAAEDVSPRTKARSPQTSGVCGRFHRTVLTEPCQAAFRKRIDAGAGQLQADLDGMASHNDSRPHQGRRRCGKTPMQTFLDTVPLAREKRPNAAA